jgi:hypothetical protein
MKMEATLTGLATIIIFWFALTRDPYAMGATVFVATPLYMVSMGFFIRRVFKELSKRKVL